MMFSIVLYSVVRLYACLMVNCTVLFFENDRCVPLENLVLPLNADTPIVRVQLSSEQVHSDNDASELDILGHFGTIRKTS